MLDQVWCNLYNSGHYLDFCCVDWEKTSLKPYVDFLDKHVQSILDEARQAKLKSGQHSYLHIKVLQLNDPRRYVLVVSMCKWDFDVYINLVIETLRQVII